MMHRRSTRPIASDSRSLMPAGNSGVSRPPLEPMTAPVRLAVQACELQAPRTIRRPHRRPCPGGGRMGDATGDGTLSTTKAVILRKGARCSKG